MNWGLFDVVETIERERRRLGLTVLGIGVWSHCSPYEELAAESKSMVWVIGEKHGKKRGGRKQ